MPESTLETQAALEHESAPVSGALNDAGSDSPVDATRWHDVTAESPAGTTPPALRRGSVVGRFVTLNRIGAGAMGVVYAAYDPELDRKVAIKLLQPGLGEGTRGTDGRARLLREAQALARLSHPNVVTVHDVGTVEERVWIAMEFVEGETLSDWLAPAPPDRRGARSWRAALEVLMAAGRGLAAAHSADLLHRDFKPDNVMVGADGRARVMDFGLARAQHADRAAQRTSERAIEFDLSAGPDGSPLAYDVTQPGALMGTPAYMAPEQFGGEPATARSDQFAFCVALWEALYGQRPFAGDSLIELATAVVYGDLRPVPSGRHVPRWLKRVCQRGLATDPDARFESMASLLGAIERGHARARTRRVLGAVGFVGLGVAAVLGGRKLDEHRRIRSCEAEGAAIAEVWNADVRTRVDAALRGTGLAFADATAQRVLPHLDAQVEAWRERRTDACMADSVDARWDAGTAERSRWCFDDRRTELTAVIAQLERADPSFVQQALQSVMSMRRVDECVDEFALAAAPAPPPTASADAVGELRARLSHADMLLIAGRHGEALEHSRAALRSAEALGWAPLIAAAQANEAAMLEANGEYDQAETTAVAAYSAAAIAGDWDTAARVATSLIFDIGYTQVRKREGLVWAENARVAIHHAGDPSGMREAQRVHNIGSVHFADGEYQAARESWDTALEMSQGIFGAEHPRVAKALGNLGLVHRRLAQNDTALELHRREVAMWEAVVGPDHPAVALALGNMGHVYWARAEFDRALEVQQRAYAIEVRALGDAHPRVAKRLDSLGNVYDTLGEPEKAIDFLNRALKLREATLGPEHPDVAGSLSNLGIAYTNIGQPGRAIELHRRALRIFETAHGPDHPYVGLALNNLGRALVDSGEFEEGREFAQRGLVISEARLGADHVDLAFGLTTLGDALIGLRRGQDALVHLDRGLELRRKANAPEELLSRSGFARARALMIAAPSEAERAEALTLAREARNTYDELGRGYEMWRDEVDAWLARSAINAP